MMFLEIYYFIKVSFPQMYKFNFWILIELTQKFILENKWLKNELFENNNDEGLPVLEDMKY